MPAVRKALLLLLISLLIIVGMNACAELPESTPTPIPSPVATLAVTDTQTPTPPPPSESYALTPTEIFDYVSPSVAYVEVPDGSGSGFLIDDGYLVTNAHVVWPYDKVRVVFPDGTEFKDAPVIGWDLIADSAVIGPLQTDLPPVTITNGESLEIGSNVYLIGYPGETEEFPTPTISSGIISRYREWERAGITFFQSDASIAGGQSGGVLVSDQGDVIGVSGLGFPGGGFALVASAADVLPRVYRMIDGENTDGLGRSIFPRHIEGKTEHQVAIENFWEQAPFLFWPEVETKITVELDADPSLELTIVDATGDFPEFTNEASLSSMRGIEFLASHDVPHFIIVGGNPPTDVFDFFEEEIPVVASEYPVTGTLRSSVPVRFFADPDDQHGEITLGETIPGAIDYPGDTDIFHIHLKKGQSIHALLESILPTITIGIATQDGNELLAQDSGSGYSFFGMSPEFSFTAPETGDYLLVIQSKWSFFFAAGYYLTIESYEKGAPTPIIPTPTATPVVTKVGKMAVFNWPFSPRFVMQYPADWEPDGNDLCYDYEDESNCFGDTWNSVHFLILEVTDIDLTSVESILDTVESDFVDEDIVSRNKVENSNGHIFDVLHFRSEDGAYHEWIAITTIDQYVVIADFNLTDVEALIASDEADADVYTDEIDKARYPGGSNAFEMILQSINSFDTID